MPNYHAPRGYTVTRKTPYNKKSPRTIKKLTELINLMYETRQKDKRFYWVTLTTLQHKTGKSDKDLFYSLKKFIQHRGVEYICVAERQRDNWQDCESLPDGFKCRADLHFHLIIQQTQDFDIQKEIQRCAEVFGVEYSTHLFNVKRVFDAKQLVGYISKYVRKSCPSMDIIERSWQNHGKPYKCPKTGKQKESKKIQPYSSLFECRTFSYSGSLGKRYKEKYSTFVHTIDANVMPEIPSMLVEKYVHPFFTVYKWNDDIWNFLKGYKPIEVQYKPQKVWQDEINKLLNNVLINTITPSYELEEINVF